MKVLHNAFIEGSFVLDLDERDMASVLHQALENLVARGVLPTERREQVEVGLLERERQVWMRWQISHG